jgi:hypothetical protein
MTQASLQRLIITFKPEELFPHALYRTQDGTNPATKARCKEGMDLMGRGSPEPRAKPAQEEPDA